ncbi:putative bacteriophage protein [Escherichia coli DEC3F]|nr:hypothetical protein ECO2687_07424 [Escherichia coli O157:H- str. H 2687]EHU88548.1 putative bacteriophage protein [Escherichia coli DEC3F]EIO51203.1 putative bacteriophage protein [Escherichia coli TW06591]EKI12096.1 putative bacteriophage protein [Escherichia coli 5412]KJJ45020.1 hypothetical protein VM92_21065 [Escherichia coli]
MITSYEATVVTTDDIVHEVTLEGKRIGYVIKTENKETPFTVVDIDGPSGNVKTLNDGVKKNVSGAHRKESARRKKSRISGNSDCNEIRR